MDFKYTLWHSPRLQALLWGLKHKIFTNPTYINHLIFIHPFIVNLKPPRVVFILWQFPLKYRSSTCMLLCVTSFGNLDLMTVFLYILKPVCRCENFSIKYLATIHLNHKSDELISWDPYPTVAPDPCSKFLLESEFLIFICSIYILLCLFLFCVFHVKYIPLNIFFRFLLESYFPWLLLIY